MDISWGEREQQKKQQVKKQIRDLNAFRDPTLPLHLVEEKMCPYAPPGQALLHQPAVSPGCGRRIHNGNQHGTQRV